MALSKRQKKLVDVVQPFDPPNYHPYYIPYSNLNSHMPFHSSFTNQSPFGVNGDSYVIHNLTLEEADAKKNNEEDDELDLDLKL